jgi:hypothetical protein
MILKNIWVIIAVFFVAFGFISCGETSIYNRWSYEDKGVRYEIRLFNEFREDKYEQFRDGKRTSVELFH